MRNLRKGVSIFTLSLVIFMIIGSSSKVHSTIDETDFTPLNSKWNGSSISNFDDFTKLTESEHITSTKSSSDIAFDFNGSSNSWVTERYIYAIDDGQYCENFSIQATIDYSYTDTNDLSTVGMIVGSYYDGDNNYLGQPENLSDQLYAYTNVMDSWSGNQAVHQVVLMNNSVDDELFDSYGSAGLTGTVLINQTKKAGSWTCSVMDSSGSTTYVTRTWTDVSQEINYIIIFFNALDSNTDVSATVSSITGNLDIIYENEVIITDFQDFSVYEDESIISSVNGDSYISFNYNGGSSTSSLTEAYVLPLDTYGNCDYFDILIRYNYTTTADDDLIEMKLKLGSFYNFQGMYIGKDYANQNNVFYSGGVWDAWSSNERKYFVGCEPYDVWEQYTTSDNSLPLSGDITEHLIRNKTGLYVELYDTATNNTILNHNWTDGIDKPINFLYLEFQSGSTNSQAEAIVYEIHAKLNFVQEMGVSLKWSYDTGSAFGIVSNPVFADLNKDENLEIIFGARDNYLYCLDQNGLIQWQYDTSGWVQEVTIADIDQDEFFEVIFVHGGTVRCLNHNGTSRWSYGAPSGIYSAPSIADLDSNGDLEILFASQGSSKVYCLNSTGNLFWEYTAGGALESSIAIADLDNDSKMEVIFGSMDNNLYCLNYSGQFEWSYLTGDSIKSSPSIADLDCDGTYEILFGSNDNSIYCLDHLGALNWSYTTFDDVLSSPGIADINNDGKFDVVIGSNDDNVYCLLNNGTLLWNHTTNDDVVCSPTIADLNNDSTMEVIVGSYDNVLYCLDHNGVTEWFFETNDSIQSSPCIVDLDNDSIFEIVCVSWDGYIYCLELVWVDSSGLAPWYCFHGSIFHTGQLDRDSDYLDDLTEEYYNTDELNDDSDSDTVKDGKEIFDGTDPNDQFDFIGSNSDIDHDGLTYAEELALGTNPNDSDSDDDNLSDGAEVNIFFTNPLNNDTDSDNLIDGDEILGIYSPANPGANATGYVHTNATNPDSDGDLYSDFEEINSNTDPNNPLDYPGALEPDNDEDGLPDALELILGTDPYNNDTDFDGLSDGIEVLGIYEPNNLYCNESGYLFTNPLSNDTDSDGIFDFEEVYEGNDGFFTDPTNSDSDLDEMPDLWEIVYSLDPNFDDSNLDYDNDKLTNLEEFNYNTDPRNADTDADGFDDGFEVNKGTDPNDPADHPIFHNWEIGLLILGLVIAVGLLSLSGVFLNKKMPDIKKKMDK
ncbi:MAG: FG-GAP-like repeat-containing protein, partial [Candidatus Heimdallarchaeota archaeon]